MDLLINKELFIQYKKYLLSFITVFDLIYWIIADWLRRYNILTN